MRLSENMLIISIDITLSSRDENPKNEFDFTSFKHLAHLWIAYFVKLTRKGIKIIERNPNNSIENIATRYPSTLVRYSTIEYETASQKGHFTFVDLYLG